MTFAVARADRATLGIAAMALATAVFACNDVVAKWLVGHYGVGQVLLVRSFGAAALVVIFHQVVHPVLAGKAGVARLQRVGGGPDERAQECSPDGA